MSLDSASSTSFFSTTAASTARQPAPHPISTSIAAAFRSKHPAPATALLGSAAQPQHGPAMSAHHPYHHSQSSLHKTLHQPHSHHQQLTSLPSPPLSSVEPPPSSAFFLKSPFQEYSETHETETSPHRIRHKQRSSILREKRLSFVLQPLSDPRQSFQSLRLDLEVVRSKLHERERELAEAKSIVGEKNGQIQQFEAIGREHSNQLQEILVDRDALSKEMATGHADHARTQKRLDASVCKVEKLQQENRQLMDQLMALRNKDTSESNSVEDSDICTTSKDVEQYKAEVDRLQELLLSMSSRHVQDQAQVQFFQQQSRQIQRQLDLLEQQAVTGSSEPAAVLASQPKPSSPSSSPSSSASARKHGSLGEIALSSLLSSVAAASSYSRRTKPSRRFTVNAPRKEGELVLEQRKCEFLMEQISVLQRGYDTLRQEKVTLELQLDLMQRQHQYHQQQRQKRRESQRRTLGHEQSASLSAALANMSSSNSSQSPSPPMSSAVAAIAAAVRNATTPSTPLLPSFSVAEQEREKARIQHELEQAHIRAQQEAQAKEAKRLAAKAAAEAAEREAIQLKRLKDHHVKETLASLEARRGRSDSKNITFADKGELKHLESLRLTQDQSYSGSAPSSPAFQSAAAARASRRIMSPISFHQRSSSSGSATLSSSPSPIPNPSMPSPQSSLATIAKESLSSSPSTPSSSSSKASSSKQTLAHYTHHGPTMAIEQCSCCIGAMIDL
ncbi:hypothetical protein BGW38_005591 [Lunasporangiospora selenospora]|uniref:Uncharacterized protein n=1 Tax=Lunasporangiospora selenospora TaxID=979761 RepID=A0A9P6KH22_9FUNG|nr:hypothetical protein BGW38_005591 [Lunasporangiospora selenospora]